MRTVSVLGHQVAVVSAADAARLVVGRTAGPPVDPGLTVTLNPEIIVRARENPELRAALGSAWLTVADGVGVVWAARRAGAELPGRVPGVELVADVLDLGGAGLRVFFLGGRPGVAERAAATAQERWGVSVAGFRDGYFDREQEAGEVAAQIARSGATLLLAALGEDQELFMHRYRHALGDVRAMIGVGGTLDVLAGEVKRTPEFTRRLGIEWLWRVGLDRSRWHRFPRLLRFARMVLSEPRKS